MNGTNDSGDSKKSRKLTPEDAQRIQSAADRNPNSKSAKTGFKSRAQSAADRSTGRSKRAK